MTRLFAAAVRRGRLAASVVGGGAGRRAPASCSWRSTTTGRSSGSAHVLDLDGHWHLEQIAVDPAHGRRGVGAAAARGHPRRGSARRGGPRSDAAGTYADVPWNGPFYAQHGYVELDPLPTWLEPLCQTEQRMDMEQRGRRVAMLCDLTAR